MKRKRTTKTVKPTRNKIDEMDEMKDFIVDDVDYDTYSEEETDVGKVNIHNIPHGRNSEYEFVSEFQNKRRKLGKKHEERLKTVEVLCNEQEISLQKILELNIPDNQLVWFIEYFKILDNIEPETEERYRVKTMIYNKYKELEKSSVHTDAIVRLKKVGNIHDDIVSSILSSKHSEYVKAVLYKKYEKYINIDDPSRFDEYFKMRDWIETVLDLPIEIKHVQQLSMADMIVKLIKCLDSKLYGLKRVKESVIEAFCASFNNPNYNKKFLALVGPPGVGKTAIAMAIAEAGELPFEQISVGAIKDANVLIGHSSTYVGSGPGLLVNILRKTKILNSVVLLDEIDKIAQTNEGQSINSVLVHVLDKTQNKNFKDSYMPEINIDLSNVFFMLAMNDHELVDPILKDRLQLIEIAGYDLSEKIEIGLHYILPKLLSDLRFDVNDIKFNRKTMEYLITNKCHKEDGVRDLEKKLMTLCEKLNVLKYIKGTKKRINLSYSIDNIKFPITITEQLIDQLIKY